MIPFSFWIAVIYVMSHQTVQVVKPTVSGIYHFLFKICSLKLNRKVFVLARLRLYAMISAICQHFKNFD